MHNIMNVFTLNAFSLTLDNCNLLLSMLLQVGAAILLVRFLFDLHKVAFYSMEFHWNGFLQNYIMKKGSQTSAARFQI